MVVESDKLLYLDLGSPPPPPLCLPLVNYGKVLEAQICGLVYLTEPGMEESTSALSYLVAENDSNQKYFGR